jgi:hypothetical protein
LAALRAELMEELCELRVLLLHRLPAPAPEPPQGDGEAFINVAQAAELARVAQTVRNWIAAGTVAARFYAPADCHLVDRRSLREHMPRKVAPSVAA